MEPRFGSTFGPLPDDPWAKHHFPPPLSLSATPPPPPPSTATPPPLPPTSPHAEVRDSLLPLDDVAGPLFSSQYPETPTTQISSVRATHSFGGKKKKRRKLVLQDEEEEGEDDVVDVTPAEPNKRRKRARNAAQDNVVTTQAKKGRAASTARETRDEEQPREGRDETRVTSTENTAEDDSHPSATRTTEVDGSDTSAVGKRDEPECGEGKSAISTAADDNDEEDKEVAAGAAALPDAPTNISNLKQRVLQIVADAKSTEDLVAALKTVIVECDGRSLVERFQGLVNELRESQEPPNSRSSPSVAAPPALSPSLSLPPSPPPSSSPPPSPSSPASAPSLSEPVIPQAVLQGRQRSPTIRKGTGKGGRGQQPDSTTNHDAEQLRPSPIHVPKKAKPNPLPQTPSRSPKRNVSSKKPAPELPDERPQASPVDGDSSDDDDGAWPVVIPDHRNAFKMIRPAPSSTPPAVPSPPSPLAPSPLSPERERKKDEPVPIPLPASPHRRDYSPEPVNVPGTRRPVYPRKPGYPRKPNVGLIPHLQSDFKIVMGKLGVDTKQAQDLARKTVLAAAAAGLTSSQLRSLRNDIKANVNLTRQLMEKTLTADQLVAMSEEERATDKRKADRQSAQQNAMVTSERLRRQQAILRGGDMCIPDDLSQGSYFEPPPDQDTSTQDI